MVLDYINWFVTPLRYIRVEMKWNEVGKLVNP